MQYALYYITYCYYKQYYKIAYKKEVSRTIIKWFYVGNRRNFLENGDLIVKYTLKFT